MTGRVIRDPQSSERPRPSATPIMVALVVLVIIVLLPYILAALGYIVIGAVLLVLIARKLHLNWSWGGGGFRRDRHDRPGILVTNFRVGVPKPKDPRAIAQEWSCRLLTRHADGTLEVSRGDEVQITGRRDSSKLIHVRNLTVTATGSRIATAPGGTAAPIATITVILLGLCGLALWMNRAWLSADVIRHALAVVIASATQLVSLIVVLFITWFVIKKLIFRR